MAKNDWSGQKTCSEINDILIRREFINIDGKQISAKNDETREREGEKSTMKEADSKLYRQKEL